MKKRLKSITVVSFAVFLAAFSGQEKFIELEGYLNGRSSAAFRKIDTNVKTVLAPGTHGEILEKKQMRSGNYGLKVRVMSGPFTGKSYWVYYNVSDPNAKLYDSPPQTWDELPREQTTIENAQGLETTKPTKGIDDTDKISEKAFQETAPKPEDDAKRALKAIQAGQEGIERVPVPTPRPDCKQCSVATSGSEQDLQPQELNESDIGPEVRDMSPRCKVFMDGDGKFGRLGLQAMDIMNSRKYRDYYLKSNALGDFCPNFDRLGSDSEKLQAWTWFWTALAQEETHCVQEILHPMFVKRRGKVIKINDRFGWGFFAAEKDPKFRKSRGEACREIIGSGLGQLLCAIDTMKKTTLDDGQTASGDSGSYWGPVRRGKKQILPNMKRFKACF